MSDEKDPLADPGRPFDQTNGLADGLEGDSDGTAASDDASEAERVDRDQGGADDADGLLTIRKGDPVTGGGNPNP